MVLYMGILGHAKAAKDQEIPPNDSEALLARVGQETVVKGQISRVGVGPTGVVHFLNFSGVPRCGFVAIIKKGNLVTFSERFGVDFPFSLAGKSVRVTGTLSIYEDRPQIELLTPDQLELLE